MIIATELDDHVQKAVDAGLSGLHILHGEMNRMLVEAEEELILAQEEEERSGEAMDSMERRYWEGQCDAIQALYTLAYGLSFAIGEESPKAFRTPGERA
jgi:hypothetical protein